MSSCNQAADVAGLLACMPLSPRPAAGRRGDWGGAAQTEGSDVDQLTVQARKITEHRKKELMTGDAPAAPFVWTKKIEKDIVEGASVKNFSKRAEREKHEERMVRSILLTTGYSVVASALPHVQNPQSCAVASPSKS